MKVYDDYVEEQFDIHSKALKDPYYKDLTTAYKYLKCLIQKQSERLHEIKIERLKILDKHGWKDDWIVEETDYAEGYYGKNKV